MILNHKGHRFPGWQAYEETLIRPSEADFAPRRFSLVRQKAWRTPCPLEPARLFFRPASRERAKAQLNYESIAIFMKQQSLVESFNSAIEGFVYVFKSQRNMRLHFAAGFFVAILGIFLNFTYIELILLSLTITFVLFAEMFNTAIEHTIDLVKEEFHPLARIVKDICAGAVLLSALSAVIVGYILFISRAGVRIEANVVKIRESSWHITFIALLVILGLVVLSKIMFHSGTPLRGGMPSGHSAIAFSIWAIVSLLFPTSLVIFLVFILAFLVARSRIRDGVHSAMEVFAGSILSVLVTVLIFQILRR